MRLGMKRNLMVTILKFSDIWVMLMWSMKLAEILILRVKHVFLLVIVKIVSLVGFIIKSQGVGF